MVENVCLFVSDALRWDYLPERVGERGRTLKTISASTKSPPSFASLLSGLTPPRHGVVTFLHQLAPEYSMLNLSGFDTSFREVMGPESDPIYDVLGYESGPGARLDELEAPFLYVERELSTHAPYARSSRELVDIHRRDSMTDSKFFATHRGDWDALRSRYRDGVETATDRFEERLRTLDDRGILDETLVLFTSDHGELLGEYGEFSHGNPLVPELVYVPTVVIHPDDPPIDVDYCRHVDLLPTMADVLGIDVPWTTDGVSVYAAVDMPLGYCEYRLPEDTSEMTRDIPWWWRYEQLVRSVWDARGGWAFNESGTVARARHLFLVLLQNSKSNRYSAIRHQVKRTRRLGEPGFDAAEARRTIERVLSGDAPSVSADRDMTPEQEEQLRNLGYL